MIIIDNLYYRLYLIRNWTKENKSDRQQIQEHEFIKELVENKEDFVLAHLRRRRAIVDMKKRYEEQKRQEQQAKEEYKKLQQEEKIAKIQEKEFINRTAKEIVKETEKIINNLNK